MHVDVTAVYTNTNSIRPYRAMAVLRLPTSSTGSSSGCRRAWRRPVELRRRNYIPADAMPFKTPSTFTYDCGEFEKNMDNQR